MKAKGGMQSTDIMGINQDFFRRIGAPKSLQQPIDTTTPQSCRHLPGRAAAGVELAKLELSQSDLQIRLDNSSKPHFTISARKGLHLSEQLRMARLVPSLQRLWIKPCRVRSATQERL